MANRYWVGGNATWDATAGTKWALSSGGAGGQAVPTAADAVFLDNGTGHGNVTINDSARTCLSLNCTGYVDTLTFAGGQFLSVAGSITLVAGMTISAGAGFNITATATLTSAGKAVGFCTMSGTSQTFTLADNWTFSGTCQIISTTALTLNGNILSCGDLIIAGSGLTSGTTAITITAGTWTHSGAGILRNNLSFAGNVTLDPTNTLKYNTGTITYTSGTITNTNSTLSCILATTFNTNGMTWNNITLANVTFTLSSNLQSAGTLLLSAGAVTFTGAHDITCGNFNWPAAPVATGTCTLSGNITGTGNLTLTNTTSTTFAGLFRIDMAGNATISGSQTITLVQDLIIRGTTTSSDANVINGAFNWTTGGLTTTGALTGTSTIVFGGVGTWTGAAGTLSMNVVIATNTFTGIAQTLTMSGTCLYSASGAKTILGQTGPISGGTLSIATACTLNMNGVAFNNILITAAMTLTLGSALPITANFTFNTTGTLTFSGAYAITTATMTTSGAGAVVLALSGSLTGTGLWTNSATTSFTFTGGFGFQFGSCTISGTQTITLPSDVTITGLTTISDATVMNNTGGNWRTGGLTVNGALTGTAFIIFSGTGTWSGSSSLSMTVQINTTGTLTISGTVFFAASGTPLIGYAAGTVVTTGSTLSIASSCSIATAGMASSWNNITLTAALTLTTDTVLTLSGTLTLPNAAVTFAGAYGITAGTWANTAITAARVYTFTAGNTYTITTAMSLSGRCSGIGTAYVLSMVSSSGVSVYYLNLGGNASQDVGFVTATRVDSSGGAQGIFDYKGTLTTTTNWFTAIQGVNGQGRLSNYMIVTV